MPYQLLERVVLGAGERIEVRNDMLTTVQSTLSRIRDGKIGKEAQEDLKDPKGHEGCLLCHPSIKIGINPAGSVHEKVGDFPAWTFINDFPYLPIDHRLFFLREEGKEHRCHRFHIAQIDAVDLFFLLSACLVYAKKFQKPRTILKQVRMVAGFNIGKLAGQSQAHIHLQYGWEVVLNEERTFSKEALAHYHQELTAAGLVLEESQEFRLAVPWAPPGGFAVDLYAMGRHRFDELTEADLKLISVVGGAIISRYYWYLGLTNLNIVINSSPYGLETEPLVFRFVPRLNLTALYEIHGSNVVDTFPETIVAKFKEPCKGGPTPNQPEGVLPWPNNRPVIPQWPIVFANANSFDPWIEYRKRG